MGPVRESEVVFWGNLDNSKYIVTAKISSRTFCCHSATKSGDFDTCIYIYVQELVHLFALRINSLFCI